MNNLKSGLIVKITIHNIFNEWRINTRMNAPLASYKAYLQFKKLVKYSKMYYPPCVATALDLPYRHLQLTPKGLKHAMRAVVLILDDTALKGMKVYE